MAASLWRISRPSACCQFIFILATRQKQRHAYERNGLLCTATNYLQPPSRLVDLVTRSFSLSTALLPIRVPQTATSSATCGCYYFFSVSSRAGSVRVRTQLHLNTFECRRGIDQSLYRRPARVARTIPSQRLSLTVYCERCRTQIRLTWPFCILRITWCVRFESSRIVRLPGK
jgi:hypothetical protein